MGRRHLAALALLLWATAARAQDSAPDIVLGTTYVGRCHRYKINSNDILIRRDGDTCTWKLSPLVPHSGGCLGDNPSEICQNFRADGRTINVRAGALYVPCASSNSDVESGCSETLPTNCAPGDVHRTPGTSSVPERICWCERRPCLASADCGTGGSCDTATEACTQGGTGGRWACNVGQHPMFGNGLDGYFNFPAATKTSGSCATYSQGSAPDPAAATVCPPECATCGTISAGNPSLGCSCTLALNSYRGNHGFIYKVATCSGDNDCDANIGSGAVCLNSRCSTGYASVEKNYSGMLVGNGNVVTVADRTGRYVEAGCGVPVGTDAIFRVLGDATFYGTAKVDLKGKGACPGSATPTLPTTTTNGLAGCAAFSSDTPGAPVGQTAGGNAPTLVTPYILSLALPPLLYGAGGETTPGGAAACMGVGNVLQPLWGAVPNQTWGGGSGASGGCGNGAGGTGGSPGAGGGGLAFLVGGLFSTVDVGGNKPTFDTSAAACTGNGIAGGAGAGAFALYYARRSIVSGTAITRTGAAGGGAYSNCAAGGRGADGPDVEVLVP